MKKAATIICISLLITSALWGIGFNLTHTVDMNAKTIFAFWKPDGSMTSWDNNTRTFEDSVNNATLAILGVQYDNTFSIASIVMSFGQMKGVETGIICPYHLSFKDPGNDASLEQRSDCTVTYASDLPNNAQSGAGTATIYKNGHEFAKYTNNGYDPDEIAKILFSVDLSEMPVDTYSTTLTVVINYP